MSDNHSPNVLVTRPAAAAAQAVADLDWSVWGDLGERFTCREADVLAELLRQWGAVDSADALLESHAGGDDEGDEHYQGE